MSLIHIQKGLKQSQVKEIIALSNICGKHLDSMLNLSILKKRNNEEISDFLIYNGNKLIGYLGVFSIVQPEEVEITAFVHPDYRRKGLFKQLLKEALIECKNRGVKQILLVSEDSSQEARLVGKAIGTKHEFTEYRLDYSPSLATNAGSPITELIIATDHDRGDLITILMSSFGDEEDDVRALLNRNLGEEHFEQYIAKVDGNPVGAICVSLEEDQTFITGFAVHEKYQGKGYGRDILTQLTHLLKKRGKKQISLEVETDNEHALNLYLSCGFQIVAGFRYDLITSLRQ